MEDELYSELVQGPKDVHYSGYVYKKDNKDYLFNKKIFKTINVDYQLTNIIQ